MANQINQGISDQENQDNLNLANCGKFKAQEHKYIGQSKNQLNNLNNNAQKGQTKQEDIQRKNQELQLQKISKQLSIVKDTMRSFEIERQQKGLSRRLETSIIVQEIAQKIQDVNTISARLFQKKKEEKEIQIQQPNYNSSIKTIGSSTQLVRYGSNQLSNQSSSPQVAQFAIAHQPKKEEIIKVEIVQIQEEEQEQSSLKLTSSFQNLYDKESEKNPSSQSEILVFQIESQESQYSSEFDKVYANLLKLHYDNQG